MSGADSAIRRTPARPLAARLLQRFAGKVAAAPERSGLPLDGAHRTELSWLMTGGLGPLLHWSMLEAEHGRLPVATRDMLRGCELAARIQHADRVRTACEVVDLCRQLAVPVVLLKGIAISEQHYPAGHLRPMTDVDVLIPAAAYDDVECAMLARGYRREPGFGHDEVHAHGPPLLQPTLGVWVELHTQLFPPRSALQRAPLFASDRLLEQEVVPARLSGRDVGRLSAEMQLIHAACAWVRDMQSLDMHPSFLPPLFDAVLLVSAPVAPIDWDRLAGKLDSDIAAASLLVLLGYLARRQLPSAPARVLAQLMERQRVVNRFDLWALHRVLDRTLLSGRPRRPLIESWHVWANLMRHGSGPGKLLRLPWRVAFPPDDEDRFDPSYQLARVSRRLRVVLRSERRASG